MLTSAVAAQGETADQTTYSQTVGSVTMSPHGCGWCHKQYASRAKLLQHQRQKHRDLLPPESRRPRPSLRANRRRAEQQEQEPDGQRQGQGGIGLGAMAQSM